MPEWLYPLCVYIFAAVAIYAALCDWQSYRIPNHGLLVLLAVWPVYALSAPAGLIQWENLASAAAILGFGMLLWQRGWIGAGDVKFLSVVMLWVPMTAMADFWFAFGSCGALLCLGLLLARRKRLPETVPSGLSHLRAPLTGQFAPYGVAIAAGCMAVVFELLVLAESAG